MSSVLIKSTLGIFLIVVGAASAEAGAVLIDPTVGEVFDFRFGDLDQEVVGDLISVTDNDGGAGFGGAGGSPDASPVALTDLDEKLLKVTFRPQQENTATGFNVSLQDTDPGTGVEDYQYNFDFSTATAPDSDGFVMVSVLLTDYDSRNAAFGQPDGDGIQNFGLTGFALNQTGTGLLNIDLASIEIVHVPEPATWCMFSLGLVGVLSRRSR